MRGQLCVGMRPRGAFFIPPAWRAKRGSMSACVSRGELGDCKPTWSLAMISTLSFWRTATHEYVVLIRGEGGGWGGQAGWGEGSWVSKWHPGGKANAKTTLQNAGGGRGLGDDTRGVTVVGGGIAAVNGMMVACHRAARVYASMRASHTGTPERPLHLVAFPTSHKAPAAAGGGRGRRRYPGPRLCVGGGSCMCAAPHPRSMPMAPSKTPSSTVTSGVVSVMLSLKVGSHADGKRTRAAFR